MGEQSGICSKEREQVVQQLDAIISELERSYESMPKKIWPDCPPLNPPPNRTVAHPYLKGVYMTEQPIKSTTTSKVTLDGRLAEFSGNAVSYRYSDPPLRIPPWFKPRTKSVELRGGFMLEGCDCWKKNGLQDDCRRWDCQRPECLSRPYPECPPANGAPVDGIRKPNAFI